MHLRCCVCKREGKENICNLFSIPKDPHIQKEWLRFCEIQENPTSNYTKYRVCNAHFKSSDIWKRYPRPLLVKNAIPTVRNVPSENDQAKPTSSSPGGKGRCSPNSAPKPSKQVACKKILLKYKTRHQQLKSQKNSATVTRFIQEIKAFLSPNTHAILTTHIKLRDVKKPGLRFNNDMKAVALSMYHQSPQVYTFLSEMISLPSIEILNSSESIFPVFPGLNTQILNRLKNVFAEKKASDRVVNLTFNEMHLNADIHYDPNSDKFVGLEDTGNSRTDRLANTALVLQIVWLTKNIKLTIGYYLLSAKTTNIEFKNIILNVIDHLNDCNILVKSIVCDQAPRNQHLFKCLNLNIVEPYFMRNNHVVHFVYDFSHLLKSLRNNLIKSDLEYKGGKVSWKDLEHVFACSKLKKLNLIPKINENHFNLNNVSKLNVKYAAQVFSESFYTATLCYRAIFPDKFSTESAKTAEFILDIDKLFDSVNSSLLHKPAGHKLNYAITKNSEHSEFLKQMIDNFISIKFSNKRNPPCINGWILSIRSILNLFKDLNENYNVDRLQTRRLNQNSLENVFAVIRQKHECNTNPSVQNFEAGFRDILINQLSKLSTSTSFEADLKSMLTKLNSSIWSAVS